MVVVMFIYEMVFARSVKKVKNLTKFLHAFEKQGSHNK